MNNTDKQGAVTDLNFIILGQKSESRASLAEIHAHAVATVQHANGAYAHTVSDLKTDRQRAVWAILRTAANGDEMALASTGETVHVTATGEGFLYAVPVREEDGKKTVLYVMRSLADGGDVRTRLTRRVYVAMLAAVAAFGKRSVLEQIRAILEKGKQPNGGLRAIAQYVAASGDLIGYTVNGEGVITATAAGVPA